MVLLSPDLDHPRPRSRDEEEAASGVALRPRSWASLIAASQTRRLVGGSITVYVLFEGAGEPCCLGATSAPAPPGHRAEMALLFSDLDHPRPRSRDEEEVTAGVALLPRSWASPIAASQVGVATARCAVMHGWREWPAGADIVMYRFNLESLLQPQIGTVTRTKSWASYLGCPMEQKVPETCSLVSCTVCLEAVHRFIYETAKDNAGKTFPCRAAAPRRLRRVCRRSGIWTPREGAQLSRVLEKIVEMGVPTTNAPTPSTRILPLRSWERQQWYEGAGLSAERIAALLDRHGPCVGVVWLCPWYYLFNAADNPAKVFRGCGRDEGFINHSWNRFRNRRGRPEGVGWHAVVCYGYRFTEQPDEMHVLVLDNHTPTGPSRWVDFEEIQAIYTLNVGGPLEPTLPNLGDRLVAYPCST